jgi:hypothetical protein
MHTVAGHLEWRLRSGVKQQVKITFLFCRAIGASSRGRVNTALT